jgi:hypothetical protein
VSAVSKRLLFSTALGATLLVACRDLEDPTSATATQLVVHSVLDPTAGSTAVLIARARTGTQTTAAGTFSDDEPVTGATVSVREPNGTLEVFQEQSDARGVYLYPRSGLDPLLPGTSYTVLIHTAQGEDVIGSTTIPAPPMMATIPVQGFDRRRDTLRFSWPRVPGARSYELVIRSRRTERYRTFTDTSLVLPGTALTVNGDTIFPPGRLLDVMLTAVDVNYYEYYRAQSDPFAGASPTHLSGAVGVFGSIVPIVVTQLQVR